MLSIDCFRGDDGLVVIVTGAAAPPVVVNEDTGAAVTLAPARIDGGACACSISNPPPAMATDGFWSTPLLGPLPADREDEVRLRLEVDGQTYRPTVRRTQ